MICYGLHSQRIPAQLGTDRRCWTNMLVSATSIGRLLYIPAVFFSVEVFFFLSEEKCQFVASHHREKQALTSVIWKAVRRLQKEKKNTKKGPPGQLAKTLKTALYLQFSGMNLKLATISWTMQHSSSSKLFFIVFQPYRRRSVFCMNAATACFELSHLIFSLPASSTLLSY